jgi:hypothetical protein
LQNFSATISLMKYLLLFLTLFFSACSIKNYERNETKVIILKSPKIKFADTGYIRSTDKSIALEMFVAGQRVETIEINHLICVKSGCMSKSGFNAEYLHPSYPSDLLQNVLLGRAIYEGKNLLRTAEGFEQMIESSDVDIVYKKTVQQISFKDRKNKILLKIKDL